LWKNNFNVGFDLSNFIIVLSWNMMTHLAKYDHVISHPSPEPTQLITAYRNLDLNNKVTDCILFVF